MSIKKEKFDKVILRGGKIVIPGERVIKNPDTCIENGKITRVGKAGEKNIAVINISESEYITPGFIDLHCHLREPGNEKSETIKSGTLSAIAGGFTQVCCMPNTNPPIDNPSIVKNIYERALAADNALVSVIGCVTKNRAGKKMIDIEKMVDAGIVAVSDDGSPVYNPEIMREMLLYLRKFDIAVINHCEVLEFSKNGVINQGKISKKLGLKGIPDTSESLMVLRDILLAEQTEGRVHIAHVSTKKSVELISWAKKRGINITAETCPHYFTLTDQDCLSLNTNFKVSPPLRTKANVEAIKQGLADGTIDAIATDHAPWHFFKKNRQDLQDKKGKTGKEILLINSEKYKNWIKAKSGMIGFETAFSLGYKELVLKKYLSLEKYIACLTTRPAQILNQSAKIRKGESAALTIVNLDKTWVLTAENILSKSKNSPFIGKKLKGKVEKVILNNKLFTNI